MAKQSFSMFFTVIAISAILASQAVAFTDPPDVTALQDFYKALNGPTQLKRWTLYGGDPCHESWVGVSCSGSSVIYLNLSHNFLSGPIGNKFTGLQNLRELDLSCNNFTGDLPSSFKLLSNLTGLNLSHNFLSGPIGNVFAGLQNLRELDLSYNNFSGDLPSSFKSLANLTGLFLQNNNFTGSVAFLDELTLTNLNIENNSIDLFLIKQVSFSSILEDDEHKSKVYLALVFILFIGVGLVLASKPNNTGKGKRKLDEEELKPLNEKFTKRGFLVIKDQKVEETDTKEEEPEVKDRRRKKAPSPPKVKVPAHEPDPTTDPEDF